MHLGRYIIGTRRAKQGIQSIHRAAPMIGRASAALGRQRELFLPGAFEDMRRIRLNQKTSQFLDTPLLTC